MTNEQAALIAAAQVVGGLLANGWFKTDIRRTVLEEVKQYQEHFLNQLPTMTLCDVCADEIDSGWKVGPMGMMDFGPDEIEADKND